MKLKQLGKQNYKTERMTRKKKTKSIEGPVIAVSSVNIKGTPIVSVLTGKETEVLQWAARGYGDKHTALEMKTGERMIETYRQNILAKLNVDTMKEAISIGLEKWMID